MAEPESQEGNYDNRGQNAENFKMDILSCLREMERLTVHVACMTYDCVNTQTNPDLPNAMQRLERAFLMCKEEIEKGKRCWWNSEVKGKKKE